MRKIKTWRDPYDEGFTLTRPKEIELKTGLTVLVGCNGAGKTTLLNNIKAAVKQEPFLYFNNLTDGGTSSFNSLLHNGDVASAATLWTSSEGEQITHNIAMIASQLREFLRTGETIQSKKSKRWASIFKNPEEINQEITSKERWILLDAVDSGLSIDNVVDVKENLFDLVIKDAKELGLDVYIIISANEYELARNSSCFDVNSGKYIEFDGYEDFRKFILSSRKKKDKRIERMIAKSEKDF